MPLISSLMPVPQEIKNLRNKLNNIIPTGETFDDKGGHKQIKAIQTHKIQT